MDLSFPPVHKLVLGAPHGPTNHGSALPLQRYLKGLLIMVTILYLGLDGISPHKIKEFKQERSCINAW